MILRYLLLVLLVVADVAAQNNPEWTKNHQPFRIVGNLYYVGSDDLASYLVATPEGLILINSNLQSSVPQIRHNIEALGFHFSNVKILLISHAHCDHDAGSASIKQLTGAKYEVMDADVPVVETGGKADFFYGGKSISYTPAKVDRILHDGDEVTLGGSILTAHLTAGHTKGCTTWTMRITDEGKTYNVVIVGSTSINSGYKLKGDPRYPQISADYERTFRTLKSLPCDIFLGAHGSYFGLNEKYARLHQGGQNPFIDAQGYASYVEDRERAYRRELIRQITTGH